MLLMQSQYLALTASSRHCVHSKVGIVEPAERIVKTIIINLW